MADTSYIDRVTSKRQQAGLVAALRGTKKTMVVVANQNDLKKSIADMATQTVLAIKSLRETGEDGEELRVLKDLDTGIKQVSKALERYETAIERQSVQLIAAIRKIEVQPAVTTHNVTSSDGSEQVLNLSDYRAHDLDNAPDNKQYIGFIAPSGKWYLVLSDNETNRMRYYFGNGSYEAAWEERYGHDYKTLSEAAHGLGT